MSSNPKIITDLRQIRTAVYGKEVREAIADGIEQCYADMTGGEGSDFIMPTIEVMPAYSSGTKIATVVVNDEAKDLYTPDVSSQVSVSSTLGTGTKIGSANVNGTVTDLYAPNPGSTVSVTPSLNSGTQIASINVDGTQKKLYAPNPGNRVTVTQIQNTGARVATIDVDGQSVTLYAPTPSSGGEGGSIVSVDPVLTSGTHIATLTIDGANTQLYAPEGGGSGGGSTVSVVSELPSADAGTPIATITVDGQDTTISAPTLRSEGLFDLIYPVGSIYMSVNSVNPGLMFGGTWDQIMDKFILAAGSTYAANSTGGSAEHAHTTASATLTVAQIPQHYHTFVDYWATASGAGTAKRNAPAVNGDNTGIPSGERNNRGRTTGVISSASNMTERGGADIGQPHSHGNTGSTSSLPPYLAVYVWKRTA